MCESHYRSVTRKQLRQARALGEIDCHFCGTPFPPKSKIAKYCSPECYKAVQTLSAQRMQTAKRSRFRRAYGLELEQVEEMAARGCWICGTHEWGGPWHRPHVDHDHATGKVRGILCRTCNFGIGYFKDDPVLLEAAVRYLAAANA